MTWQLIEYNLHPGKYNMDFDLQLVKDCKSNSPILRFYGWDPYCISIGANQSFNEINSSHTEKNGIDIVKRPTGGRAILHAKELTYSVIMPNSSQISGKKLYEDISNAIVVGLRSYHPKLKEVELESITPNFPDLLKTPSGAICFASTAKSEIKFEGKKLVGSAQRKLGSTILQHGSILIGQQHKKLVDYINIEDYKKNDLKIELSDKTTELETIIGEDVNILLLQEKILNGFEEVWGAKFLIDKLDSVSLQ